MTMTGVSISTQVWRAYCMVYHTSVYSYLYCIVHVHVHTNGVRVQESEDEASLFPDLHPES